MTTAETLNRVQRARGPLRSLLDLLPHDTLMIGGKPYMRRWYVFGYAPEVDDPNLSTPGGCRRGRWWNSCLGAIRIHEIVASDDSRAFHDHPWPFVSILLRGSYIERRPWPPHGTVHPPDDHRNAEHTYRAPAINRKAATDLHVLTVERGPVWTLFLTRPKQRSWGFAGPFGWMPWREFDARFPERDAWTETS